MTTAAATELPPPKGDDAELADAACRRLARFLGQGRLALRLPDAGPAEDVVVLPAVAVEQLVQLLGAMASSHDPVDVGLTGLTLAADVWPADDFSDWEPAGE